MQRATAQSEIGIIRGCGVAEALRLFKPTGFLSFIVSAAHLKFPSKFQYL
jgi:hypothetical protein